MGIVSEDVVNQMPVNQYWQQLVVLIPIRSFASVNVQDGGADERSSYTSSST